MGGRVGRREGSLSGRGERKCFSEEGKVVPESAGFFLRMRSFKRAYTKAQF